MNIKPGKYMLRNGAKCVVLHVDTEHGLVFSIAAVYLQRDGTWHRINLKPDGHWGTSQESELDIVSEGWPVEFIVGRWYRTKAGDNYMLVADAPGWSDITARIYIKKGLLTMLSDNQIDCQIETPDYAKEKAKVRQ